jgi:hypothetical protein
MDIATLKAFSNTKLADNTNIHPSKHREVNDAIIDEIYVNRTAIETNSTNITKITPLNIGWVGNLDVGGAVPDLTLGLDAVDYESYTGEDGKSTFIIEFANEMPSLNYRVSIISVEVESGSIVQEVAFPLWKKISVKKFQVTFSEFKAMTQVLKVHFEVISLD